MFYAGLFAFFQRYQKQGELSQNRVKKTTLKHIEKPGQLQLESTSQSSATFQTNCVQ